VVVFFQRLGENVFTERYIYLPSIGLCLSVCLTLDLFKGRFLRTSQIILAMLLATLSWRSIQRNRVWRDDLIFYETTTKASPKAWGLLNNLGAAYNRLGRHQDALRTLEASVAGGPSPTALKNLGFTYAMVGRPSDSEHAFQRAIELDPQDSGAYAGLGDVLFKEGRYSEAISSYERALALYPQSTIALFAYAEACLADHRYDDSLRALKRILDLSPEESVRAYRQMSKVYLGKNLPELAAEAERKASSGVGVQLFR
jgi:tetratricopeptide (TPR) repeat protein